MKDVTVSQDWEMNDKAKQSKAKAKQSKTLFQWPVTG